MRSRRRRRAGLVAVLGTAAMVAVADAAVSEIERFRWDKRLIFVFAADTATAAAAARVLEGAGSGIEERHVLWFVLAGDAVTTNYAGALAADFADRLRADYLTERPAPPVAVVLVGKDGGVKYRASGLDLADLFREIDGMPMRRREMQSARDQG